MELWDLYDQDRNPTGETMVRGDPMRDGTYHLVVHVCIFNSEGKMLIQHRQPFKSGWSDLWDITVGGSAVHGESSRSAAEREVREEIGFDPQLEGVRPSLSVNFERGYDDFYLIKRNIDVSELTLQAEEVQEVRWADLPEILSMVDAGVFIPYHKSFLELLFFMKDRMTARTHPDTTVPSGAEHREKM